MNDPDWQPDGDSLDRGEYYDQVDDVPTRLDFEIEEIGTGEGVIVSEGEMAALAGPEADIISDALSNSEDGTGEHLDCEQYPLFDMLANVIMDVTSRSFRFNSRF